NLAVDSELADPWSKTALAVATVNTAPATNPFNNGLVDPWPAPRADYDLHDIVDPWAAPN
ncbi:MAG TPA: hypothetical protein VL137_13710, partial [Polyangiaceae bacterium]|nr:hypothetical protein [Polyangiaceae bacterium]